MPRPLIEGAESRKAPRNHSSATVQFRAGQRRASVELRDISIHGARIGGVFLVHEGDLMWLRIGSLQPIEARVVWCEDFCFGCEFVHPLNEFVLESILRTTA